MQILQAGGELMEPSLHLETIVFIDMDNTLVDFRVDFLGLCQDFYPEKKIVIPSREQVTFNDTVSWLTDSGIDEDDAYQMKKTIFSLRCLWKEMQPFPDAIEVFRYLYENADVYILTSAFASGSDECLVGKKKWVEKHLPFFDITKLIYCHYKCRLIGDYFIDDMPWLFMTKTNSKIITFDYPYNRHIETDYRVKSWKEIRDLFILRR